MRPVLGQAALTSEKTVSTAILIAAFSSGSPTGLQALRKYVNVPKLGLPRRRSDSLVGKPKALRFDWQTANVFAM